MKLHPSLTAERIEDAVKRQTFDLDNPGFCVKCGDEVDGCEPDACHYYCECCETHSVFGASELFFMTGE